jgi:hypothetical protein
MFLLGFFDATRQTFFIQYGDAPDEADTMQEISLHARYLGGVEYHACMAIPQSQCQPGAGMTVVRAKVYMYLGTTPELLCKIYSRSH